MYLAIENNIAIHERESKFWLLHNVQSIRVSTMNEAIEKAMNNQFIFIGINADNVNYLSKLKLLREVTNAPIFISTSTYSMKEHRVANSLGADLYGQLSHNPEENYKAVMANITRINDWATQRKTPVKVLFHKNVLVAPPFRQTFFDDTQITLTKKEFDILHLLMDNRKLVLTFQQIYHNLWGDEYDETIHDVIRNHVKKINRKFNDVSPGYNFIVNERGVGYKLK
jgi:two-component system response regulator VanR